MHPVTRPLISAALDVATYVEAVPHTLFSRVLAATQHTVQTVQTRRTRPHRHHATTPHAANPYVMMVESDITGTVSGIFS